MTCKADVRPTSRAARHESELGLRDLPPGGADAWAAAHAPGADAHGRAVRRVLHAGVRRAHAATLADCHRDQLPRGQHLSQLHACC